MRIHRIRTINLNSLYGEQVVDVDAHLGGSPLFLIQGPTGSGKSTLMDAISLALFGQTPRLTNERGNADADARSVMSWGAGECLAEVELSKLDKDDVRRRYRVRWSCHRAHKRAEGNLKDVERSIDVREADGTWKLLYSGKKVRDTARAFDSVLEGFGVRDFQRSMLLAQGQFDALLDADPSERAAILERLTRTTEYQEIGERAARLRNAYAERIRTLEATVKEIGAVDPEALAEATLKEAEQQKNAEKARAELKSLRAAHRWLEEQRRAVEKVESAQKARAKVDEERKAASDDLSRLAEHGRCVEGFTALDDVREDERKIEACRSEIVSLDESLKTHENAAKKAVDVRAEAQKRRTRAWTLLDELKTRVATTKAELDAREVAAKEETTAGESSKEAVDKLKQAHKEKKSARKKLDDAKNELRKARHARDARKPLAALAGDWEELSRRLDDAISKERALGKENNRLADVDRDLEASEKAVLAERNTLITFEREEVVPAREALEAAKKTLTEELDGKAPEKLRSEEVQATERIKELETAEHSLGRVHENQTSRNERKAKLDAARDKLDDTNASEKKRAAEADHQEATTRTFREEHHRLVRVAAVAVHRSALEPGDPCPLCGSEKHPWVEDRKLAVSDEQIQEELQASEEKLGELEAKREKAGKTAADAQAERRAAEQLLASAKDELESAEESLSKALEELEGSLSGAGLPSGCGRGECVRALDAERAKQAEIRARLEKIEAAQTAVEKLGKEADAREKDLTDRARSIEKKEVVNRTKREELVADRARLDSARATLSEASKDLSKALVGHSLELTTDSPADWRKTARDAVAAWKKLVDAVGEAKAEIPLSEQRLEAARSLATDREKICEATEEKHEERKATLDELTKTADRARAVLLEVWNRVLAADRPEDGNKRPSSNASPEILLDSQRETVETLDSELEQATKTADEARSEFVGTKGQLAQRKSDLQAAKEGLGAHESTLSEILSKLEIEDLPTLEIRRLSLERYDELSEHRRVLELSEHEAVAKLEERVAIRDEVSTRRPDRLDENATVEEVDASIEKASEVEQEAENELDAAKALLMSLRDQERRGSEAGKALLAEKGRAAIWLQLHELIGKNNGERFKQFAQSLNLDRLIRKANHHLERLSQRYLLAQVIDEGLPTLEFSVIDRYQVSEERAARGLQGRERSPRSLSGGERFLVSLALALGLSDLRSSTLPIETLLLDEGFGTLDENTLDTALSALQCLQAGGRQVGIISHVAALRERIPAQVIVEALGEGRSTVRVGSETPLS